MKKLALVTALAAFVAMPAFAAEEVAKKDAAPAPAAASSTITAAAPAAGTKKVELKDGSEAQITGDMVSVSKDGGKTWTPASDGTLEAKDGSHIVVKGGKEVK